MALGISAAIAHLMLFLYSVVWASPKWYPLWFMWLLIGLCGGYMTGRFKGIGTRFTVIAILIGVLGGCAGGWAYLWLSGGGEQNEYISMIASVAGTALTLWLLTLSTRHTR